MTIHEGGIRVPSVIRWPGGLPAGEVRNGGKAHQEMFTALAVAAGIEDPVTRVETEMGQHIGTDNLSYWRGETDGSAGRHISH